MSKEEEEYVDPLLKLKGVTPELAAIFKEAGYCTVQSLAVEVPHILVQRVGEKRGFNVDKAWEIIKEARSTIKVEILTAAELFEEEKKRKVVSTGSKALDEILDGGIRTHELTEVLGAYGLGKTELLYTSAVLSINTLKGGAWILDTEATLSSKRILEIAKARGLDVDFISKQIILSKVASSAELTLTLETAHKRIKEQNIRFLGIDSFVSPFRREYPGREFLAPRQQKINYCAGMLLKYARFYEMVILVTNQVLATPVAYQFTHRPEILNPGVGGHVMSFASNNRIYLQETSEPNKTIATLIDSSYLPRQSRTFRISAKGVDDVEGTS
jgi:DNA repair protein RadA